MKLFKKILTVAAVLAFVVTTIPARALAATNAIDFEDGNIPASVHLALVEGTDTIDGDPAELSVVDLNGSQVLKIDPTAKGTPKLIIDVAALVGEANIGLVKGLSFDLAIEKPTNDAGIWTGGCVGAGNYNLGSWTNGTEWSIQDDANLISAMTPLKTQMVAGQGFADVKNAFFMFMNWANNDSITYMDNIKLLDADGNALDLTGLAAAEAPAEEAAATDVPKTGVVGLGIVYGLSALATGAFALKRKQR